MSLELVVDSVLAGVIHVDKVITSGSLGTVMDNTVTGMSRSSMRNIFISLPNNVM